MTPELSVVMPNFNHEHYLPVAIESILNQSFGSLELLIVDDASLDNSVEIIQNYQKIAPCIRLLRHKTNQGPVAAMNTALKQACGEFIALTAADDQIWPGFFEETISFLKQFPQAGLCTTEFCVFQENTPPLATYNPGLAHPCYLSPQELVTAIKKWNFWIPGNATILRRRAMVSAGHFQHSLGPLCDWFLCLVIGFRKGVCYLPKPLTAFRQTMHSYSRRHSQSNWYDGFMNLLDSEQYRDVKNAFIESGILFQLDREIFAYLLKYPKYWKIIPQIFRQKLRQKRDKHRYCRQIEVTGSDRCAE